MDIAAIFFNDAEPFEQSVNKPSTGNPMWNLSKICQVVLEVKTFTDFKVLYLYIVPPPPSPPPPIQIYRDANLTLL